MATTPDGKRHSRDKVRAYRQRLRARGFRSVRIWVPDTRTARFAEEAHRQSQAVAHSAREREDQAFIDAISGDDDADVMRG